MMCAVRINGRESYLDTKEVGEGFPNDTTVI